MSLPTGRHSTAASDRPALPEDLDPPDVGFVATAGVYGGVVLVAVTLAVTLATGGTAAAALGAITSVSAGIVLGALAVNHRRGLPERMGRSRRLRAAPVAGAGVFVLATVAILLTEAVPDIAAVGTALGAVGTLFAGGILSGMARTRYARAVTPDDPRAAFARVHPTRHRHALAVSALSFAAFVGLVLADQARAGFWLLWVGLFSLLTGATEWDRRRRDREDADRSPSRLRRFLPERAHRTVLGSRLSQPMAVDADDWNPAEIRVHDAGLVLANGNRERLVPWSAVDDVRLTDDELVIERSGWVDLRCDRSAIDDAEAVTTALDDARERAMATR